MDNTPPNNPQENTAPNPTEIDVDLDPEIDLDEVDEQEDAGPLLQWKNIEPASPPRPHWWFIVMGLIAAIIIIAGIWTKAWIIIPLGVLIPIALTMYGNKGPGEHEYSLEPFGVHVDQKAYRYDTFKAFFVIETETQTTFELIPLQRLGALVTLHATSENAEDILEILSSVLPETEPQGYLGESVFKRLKF